MEGSKTHPFIGFHRAWSISNDTWFRLGQSKAMIRAIATTPIMPQYRAEIYSVSLRKGAQATTAIEGNTLSEQEIIAIQQGKNLTPGKQYMEQEVRNVIVALNKLGNEILEEKADSLITTELIKRFHWMIGKDLGESLKAIPGQFRKGQVTVGQVYRPPPGPEVDRLMRSFCEWSREEFHYEHGQNFSTAIIQAIVSHVYVAWIHPFDDGNGRTARLLEFYLLLRAGVPDIAAHILSNFYNDTRPEYYRQLNESSQRNGDLTNFIEYAVQGFKDGLQDVLDTVHWNQLEMAWQNYVHETFQRKPVAGRKKPLLQRQRALILSIELEKDYDEYELANVNEAIRIQYDNVSVRTLSRDIQDLTELGLLITLSEGYFRANTAVLRGTMAQARADRNLV